MAKRQKEESELTAEQLLEARVDAMMSVESKGPSEPTGAPLVPGAKVPKHADIVAPKKPETAAPKQEAKPVEKPASVVDTEPDEPTPLPPASAHDEIAVQPVELDTPESDAAIDDIVAEEADVVLAAEDAGLTRAKQEAATAHAAKTRIKHPIFWFLVLVAALSIIMIAVLTFMPSNTLAP